MSVFALDFAHAYPELSASALFRVLPEDFFVDEDLGFEPTGSGEHALLQIEKTGLNTLQVVESLASHAGVRLMDVGYCGLKDRHAVTRQFFSVYLGNRAMDFGSFQLPGVRVLSVDRHAQKLRPGSHRANGFHIRLREVQGDKVALAERAQNISDSGVPNYFGEQRFGRNGGNLQLAEALLGKHARIWRERKNQFAVSALRSYLYNLVLSERVANGSWCVAMAGETRPASPLWGRGRLHSQGDLLNLEQRLLEPYRSYCEVLEHVGLSQERRDNVLLPEDLHWSQEGEVALLSMRLPPGTYATAILSELLQLTNTKAPRCMV